MFEHLPWKVENTLDRFFRNRSPSLEIVGTDSRTLLAALLTGLTMMILGVNFFQRHERKQALRVFLFSLLYIPLLVVLMLLNGASVT